ncbi:MAG: lamin tail domain-containing protein [Akkermansiaceae bacterium]
MNDFFKPADTVTSVLVGFFLMINPALSQEDLLTIEFVGDDQAGYDLWPSAFSGTVSSADFSTDVATTSGTTTVSVTTSSAFGTPSNRGGSVNGTPAGYSYQNLYEDLLIASGATGFLTLDFSGLNASQAYQLTIYAWDPGASAGDNKIWTVTGGTGVPASDFVNFQDPLVDNDTFAMVFDITTTSSGSFQLRNTGGLSQSAINGFKLVSFPDLPPSIISQPQGLWDGGDEVVFEVVAGGAAPLVFQWFLNDVSIAGADSETLTIPASTWQQDGDYTVRVSNAHGSVDSDPAPVTIDIPEFPTREELTYEPMGPSSRRSGVSISEIHYHPAQRLDGRELEFIELYNSHPWPQDISGWRISGDVSYTFPEGSSLPAKDYLVVARIPGDVEWAYGVTDVAGPWENNLPNTGGRIRLRKLSDAIIQEVNYDDGDPWPLSADGAGHSLVLARPSFGEDDERAWEASHSIGGSPGVVDPVPSEDLDHVFVSAALSNSDAPLEDYLELHNAAPFAVDLSGCFLSDARDTLLLFTIPTGVSIPAGGTLRYTESQLGFSLSSTGDAIYLTNPTQTQVLDAVALPAAPTDTPFSRKRGDAPLQKDSAPSVVINEIMFHPPTDEDADEWIEIHNPGAFAKDVGGWAFTDGVDFSFPLGTQIPAGGYLVVTNDRTRFLSNHPSVAGSLVIGDFVGSLSDSGERVAISSPDGLGGFIPQDVVDFSDSNRYHRFADGRGATLERLDSGGDSNAASNWGDSDESAKSSWTTVEFTGTLAHGNSAAAASQVQMFLMGAGEALVDDVEVIPNRADPNILSNDDFESGVSGWFFQGNHRGSELETGEGFSGSNSLKLVATRRGDTGPNRARAPLTQTLAAGSQATLRARVRWLAGHPEFLIRLRGNWLEAKGILDVPTNLGTPGAVNSRAVSNAGPDIDLVTHRPLLPESGEEFSVFAQVSDPDGVGSVALRYRLDPAVTTTDVVMLDDGTGVDLSANDGIFSASVPGQSSGSLVAFQVVAEDVNAATSAYPPDGEGLVRSGDPAGGATFGNYRMWITDADVADWDSQPFRSNAPFPITFIYNDARPIYAAGAYYGGNKDSHGDPLTGSVSYDVQMPSGDELLGAGKLTLDYPVRDATNQREQLIHWFADQLKLPTLHRRDVYLYMNGSRRLTIYHDAEQPDGVVTSSHFPGEDGELFKTANDNETTDAGVRIRPFVRNLLDVFEADGVIRPARYRWTTGARARGSRTRLDDTSIIDLMQRADNTMADYEEELAEIIDMDNWMRTFALNDLASFWDSFGNPNWKNSYIYKQEGGKWVQFTWDFDVGLGTDGRDPPNQALFPSNVDANIQRMYQTPAFVRSYWRAMGEALGTFFSGSEVTPILEAKRSAYDAAGLNFTSPFSPSGAGLSLTNWIDQRVAFIQPQLNVIDDPFMVATPLDGSSTATQVITISGTAPVEVAMIVVNEIPLNIEWTSESEWEAPYTLQAGVNSLAIRALGTAGLEVASETLTVTFTGSVTWPQVVINEWMASNDTTLSDPADGDFEDWIELFNSEATEVDLEGWFLSDDPADPFKFQVPSGFEIPAGSFLLVWADDEIIQNEPAFNSDLHASFKLGVGGESILLSAPDGTLVSRVDFGQQVADKTEGRTSSGDVSALASPSPGSINGNAAPSPTVTYTSDGTTVTFTITTEPGFLYTLEASEDLLSWEAVGTGTVAASNSLEFSDLINQPRRFYRFIRTP